MTSDKPQYSILDPAIEALKTGGTYFALIVILVIGAIIILRSAARTSGDIPNEAAIRSKALIYLLGAFLLFYFGYFYIRGTAWEGHLMEWMNLLVRWVHVVAGIMWIGASFYFIFLENCLNRTEGLKDEIAGNLWAVHGGGFYYLEKYKTAPEKLPEKLHWFKYEAYLTWVSGFALLWIVYYMNASAYMIDPEVMDIRPGTVILTGIGSLVFSWFFYDLICKSAMAKRPLLLSLVMFAYITAIAFFLCSIMSGRSAYIHVGAIIGTIMAANVFFVIIPSQKALVKSVSRNLPLDTKIGKNAGLRSLHNNYFTLPVIFIMISNHFPATFGHSFNWAVLAGVSIASAGIRHYWNLVEQEKRNSWILPVSVIAIISLAIVTSPAMKDSVLSGEPVPFSQAQAIVSKHCISCHSSFPADDIWKTAPNGIKFDTPAEIVTFKDRIMARAVSTTTMPHGNKTKMTHEEREILGRWIQQGAKIE